MQPAIKAIEEINAGVRLENIHLLDLLQSILRKKSNNHCSPSNLNVHMEPPSCKQSSRKISSNHSLSRKSSKVINSRSTIRKCDSCDTITNSRNLYASQLTQLTKLKPIRQLRHQNKLMRLEKLSQKIIPKVGKKWLFGKRAKICHSEPQ